MLFVLILPFWLLFNKHKIKTFSFCFQRSSNPSFLVTVTFRASDALDNETRVRVTAYDVRESVSHTALPLGCALISLRSLIGSNSSIGAEVGKLRVALRSLAGTTVGFVSMSGYRLERDDHLGGSSESTPCRQPQIRGPVNIFIKNCFVRACLLKVYLLF